MRSLGTPENCCFCLEKIFYIDVEKQVHLTLFRKNVTIESGKNSDCKEAAAGRRLTDVDTVVSHHVLVVVESVLVVVAPGPVTEEPL